MSDQTRNWQGADVNVPAAPLNATAGVLAGGGAATLYARVYTHPTPDIAPADLAHVLDHVPATDDAPADWRLNPERLATNPALGAALAAKFDRWRAQHVREEPLGDVATVRGFVTWAGQHITATGLRVLLAPGTRIDPATAAGLATAVDTAAAACRASDQSGLGLATPSRAGLLRAFPVEDTPLVVLAGGTAQVTASVSGLELTVDDTATGLARVRDDSAPHRILLRGWQHDGNGVTALTADGPVPLGPTGPAQLLAQICPGASKVSVHEVPLTSVFANLLTALPSVARDAARAGRPLILSTGR